MGVSDPKARRGLPILLLFAAVLTLGATLKGGPQNQTVGITVNDPRPLAMAVEALEKRYGWVITYEDPAYVHISDIADLTHRVRKDLNPTKPRIFGVRGGPFTFSYTIPAGADKPQEPELLNKLLEQHHVSGNPGMFRLVQTGTVFHVVPSMRKSPDGTLEARGSILDARISVMDGERTAYDMLGAIVASVSQSIGVKVVPGIVPMNLLTQVRVQGGAKDESARTVLLRTLEATKSRPPSGATEWKLSWQLLHDPTPPGLYALNLHVVRDESQQSK